MYKISLDIREVHLGRFDNGIESHCHIDTLLTAEVKRIISRYGKGTYRTFRHHVVYRVVAPVAIFKQVIPAVQHISQSCLHHFTVVTAFILLKFQYLFPQAFQYLTDIGFISSFPYLPESAPTHQTFSLYQIQPPNLFHKPCRLFVFGDVCSKFELCPDMRDELGNSLLLIAFP